MSFVKDTFNALTGRSAEKASNSAAATSSDAQIRGAEIAAASARDGLNYLKEREQLPRQFSEGALNQLGGIFGLQGGDPNADQNLQANPLFRATMGQIPQQEEAILRNQSATGALPGALRSGGTDMMLADNQRMNTLSAYQNAMGGLQGLAGLPSNANQIAAATAGIGQTLGQGVSGAGQTLAQGQIAGANARQQGIGNTLGMGMNALALSGFSDIRLKDNIQPAGERFGHSWFTWDWNDTARALGLSGSSEGVIADLVKPTRPDLVGERDGYMTVNYDLMGAGA